MVIDTLTSNIQTTASDNKHISMICKTIIPSLLLLATSIAFFTLSGEAYKYEHFDDGKGVPAIQEKRVELQVSETLELGFRSPFHMTAYNWYFDTDVSVTETLKLSGTKRDKNPKKHATDNFVFNFTAVKESAKGQTDRLIFECYRVWEGKNLSENTVILNVTVSA